MESERKVEFVRLKREVGLATESATEHTPRPKQLRCSSVRLAKEQSAVMLTTRTAN